MVPAHVLPNAPCESARPGQTDANVVVACRCMAYAIIRVDKCSCCLQEMVENMDSTRDVWAMQLDTIRNRIIRVELLVAVASFSLMVSTVPASFFGMNLRSGLEVNLHCSCSSCCAWQMRYAYANDNLPQWHKEVFR